MPPASFDLSGDSVRAANTALGTKRPRLLPARVSRRKLRLSMFPPCRVDWGHHCGQRAMEAAAKTVVSLSTAPAVARTVSWGAPSWARGAPGEQRGDLGYPADSTRSG